MTRITTIAWGLFLACSWTWCIAMYLPVIMLERHGWAGFFVFAVPNVVGCAAFGYVVKNRSSSEAMVARNAGAMTWFSIITIAFHAFFAVFLVTELMPYLNQGGSWIFSPGFGTELTATARLSIDALLLLLGAGWALSFLNDRMWLLLSMATYAISLTALIVFRAESTFLYEVPPIRSAAALAWLTPTITFGFLFCPYLDLTFHRALQCSPSRHSFAVFGPTFLLMLILTCFLWFRAMPALGWLAMLHLAAQSIFTVGAHMRELRFRLASQPAPIRAVMLSLPIVASIGFFGLKMIIGDRPIGDSTYLRFLVFYGLVFPAYVLLFIGPWRPKRRSRQAQYAFALMMLASMPACELGFLHDRPWLLAIPLAALLLWSGLLPIQRGQAEFTTSSTKQ